MTAEDVWGPILSYLGTTRSRDASSGSCHFVKMKRKQENEGYFVLKVLGEFFFFLFPLLEKKQKKQQQQSWSAFGRGCDRAPKDFMGRCHMIHWVIGFRPVLIAGRPRPKKSRRIPTSSPPFSRMEFGLQVPHVIQGVLHSFRGPNSNHMEASVRLRTFHQQKKKKRDTRSHWLLRDGKWGVLKEKDNKQI